MARPDRGDPGCARDAGREPAEGVPAARAGRVLVRRDRHAVRHVRSGRADAALPCPPEAARGARPSGSARVGGLIPVPHWLLGLADRVPAGFAGPRVAGLVAAGVIAAGASASCRTYRLPSRSGSRDRACATRSLEAGASQAAAPVVEAAAQRRSRQNVRAAVVSTQVKGAPAEARPAARAAGAARFRHVEVVEGGGAEPAAPVAPPATLGIGDGAPAPALVPALPPVSQAPIVPVVTTHLPPLPEPPVDVVVPALPDLPIVQPPLPPALPGGVEVTIPAVASLRVGP